MRGDDVVIELLTKFIDRECYSVEELRRYMADHLAESELTLVLDVPATEADVRRAFPELEPLR